MVAANRKEFYLTWTSTFSEWETFITIIKSSKLFETYNTNLGVLATNDRIVKVLRKREAKTRNRRLKKFFSDKKKSIDSTCCNINFAKSV